MWNIFLYTAKVDFRVTLRIIMILILDDNSEIDAHVRSDLCYLILPPPSPKRSEKNLRYWFLCFNPQSNVHVNDQKNTNTRIFLQENCLYENLDCKSILLVIGCNITLVWPFQDCAFRSSPPPAIFEINFLSPAYKVEFVRPFFLFPNGKGLEMRLDTDPI